MNYSWATVANRNICNARVSRIRADPHHSLVILYHFSSEPVQQQSMIENEDFVQHTSYTHSACRIDTCKWLIHTHPPIIHVCVCVCVCVCTLTCASLSSTSVSRCLSLMTSSSLWCLLGSEFLNLIVEGWIVLGAPDCMTVLPSGSLTRWTICVQDGV